MAPPKHMSERSEQICKLYKHGGMTMREIAALYGVSHNAIAKTVKRFDSRVEEAPHFFSLKEAAEQLGVSRHIILCLQRELSVKTTHAKSRHLIRASDLPILQKALTRERTLVPTDKERFMASVLVTDSCWFWTGCKQSSGHGRFYWRGRTGYAHRASWELHNGPIPKGYEVCHNCPGGDNPSCVNPEHLFLGTHKENVQDAIRKGRHHGWKPAHATMMKNAAQRRASRKLSTVEAV